MEYDLMAVSGRPEPPELDQDTLQGAFPVRAGEGGISLTMRRSFGLCVRFPAPFSMLASWVENCSIQLIDERIWTLSCYRRMNGRRQRRAATGPLYAFAWLLQTPTLKPRSISYAVSANKEILGGKVGIARRVDPEASKSRLIPRGGDMRNMHLAALQFSEPFQRQLGGRVGRGTDAQCY